MEKTGPYVFISYSSKNLAEAESIRNLLNRNGLQSWMAAHDIPAGARYAHVIDEAIEHCLCVLLLLTREAQESDHVDREIERAVSYKKEIIPLRLDGCTLNSGFRYYIASCQMIDIAALEEENTEMQMLLQRLEEISNREYSAFDSFLEGLSRWQAMQKAYIIDTGRVQLLKELHGKIVALLKEEGYEDDCRITITPDPLGTGSASISFVCSELVIRNIPAFCEIVQHLDNFEVYPLADEKLCFAGTFRNVARVLKI